MAFGAFLTSGLGGQPPVKPHESTQTWTFSQFLLPLRFPPLRMGVVGRKASPPERNPWEAVACPVWVSCIILSGPADQTITEPLNIVVKRREEVATVAQMHADTQRD